MRASRSKKVEGRVTRSKYASEKILQDRISNLDINEMEESGDESGNKSNAEHPGVDWYTAAWMTMRSGCSVVCVRYSGT